MGEEGDVGDDESGDGEDDTGGSRAMDRQLPMLVLPLYSLLSSEQQAKVGTSLPGVWQVGGGVMYVWCVCI